MAFTAAVFSMFQSTPGTTLLALGAIGVYIASRAAADALAGGDPNRAGWRAVGHASIIGVVALLCLRSSMGRPGIDPPGVGRPAIAIGMLFSTSVTCLTLLLGIVNYLAPVATPPPERRVWPFVLPTGLLALVAGFNGHFSLIHAGMLMLLGLAIVNLWRGIRGETSAQEIASLFPDFKTSRRLKISRWLQLILALGLAVVGGWAMTQGVSQLEQTRRLFNATLLGGAVLGPLLTLPILGTTARFAEHGRSDSAMTTLIGVVLVNLCALVPLIIIVYSISGVFNVDFRKAGLIDALLSHLRTTPFPLVSWRIDSVILVVLGFALIPVSLARWTFTRIESVALIFAYAIYLWLVAFLSTR